MTIVSIQRPPACATNSTTRKSDPRPPMSPINPRHRETVLDTKLPDAKRIGRRRAGLRRHRRGLLQPGSDGVAPGWVRGRRWFCLHGGRAIGALKMVNDMTDRCTVGGTHLDTVFQITKVHDPPNSNSNKKTVLAIMHRIRNNNIGGTREIYILRLIYKHNKRH